MSKRAQVLVVLTITHVAIAIASATPPEGSDSARVESLEPGEADRLVQIADRCPTFHWGAPEPTGVSAFDLQILRLERAGTEVATHEAHRRRVPAMARLWTPSLSECLTPGTLYGWRIRAIAPGETAGAWSAVRYFELTEELSAAQLERLLVLVQGNALSDAAVERLGTPDELPATRTVSSVGRETSPIDIGGSEIGLHAVGASGVQSIAVVGETRSEVEGSVGVVGEASSSSGSTIGLAGVVVSPAGVAGVFDNLAGGQLLSGRVGGLETFALSGAGDVTAASFAGDGGALTNVDAETLDGLDSTDFMPADTDNWVNTTGDTMTGALVMQGADVDLGTGNGAIRRGSDLFVHNRASGSTALGRQALNPTSTGAGNTAVGDTALRSVTEGSSNTAIGREAQLLNLTGANNTGVGDSALRNNTATGNTGVGAFALDANDVGFANTAVGASALSANLGGSNNTAVGAVAMFANTTGDANTAIGSDALQANGTGNNNTALGEDTLRTLSSGSDNTAVGADALRNTTGSRNTGLGSQAGNLLTSGSDNVMIANVGVAAESGTIRIGSGAQTRTFVAGIRGVTTSVNDALPVLIDSSGQLGTLSSSLRYKSDVAAIADASAGLHRLRPVSYRYLAHGGRGPAQFGLIAEEVAEIFPELVVLDREGRPDGVRYQSLEALLLNEVQRLARRLDELESTISARGER